MDNNGLPASTIAFGHSNGGLISRQMTRLRPAKGVITIGTLHTGAPLAANLPWVAAWSDVLFWSNYIPADYYSWFLWWCYDCWYYDDPWLLWYAVMYDYDMAYLGGGAFAAVEYMGIRASDVLEDMQPGSNFLNVLNSSDNLNREAAEVPVRVGIGSRTWDDWGIMWQGVLPDAAWWLTSEQYTAAWLSIIAFYHYLYYWDYSDPYWWDKTMGAWLWLLAASADLSIDPMWCVLIGAWDGWCTPSDGIVPLDRQWFPGYGTRNYQITGPSHQKEKPSDELFYQTSYTLQYDFGLTPNY
jgi:hypothetical protein